MNFIFSTVTGSMHFTSDDFVLSGKKSQADRNNNNNNKNTPLDKNIT